MNELDIVVNSLLTTNYDALPNAVIEATKKQILDTLAAAIGGSTCSISNEMEGLVDLVKEEGGKEESTIIAFGGQVPAPAAAFVNGILCVRLDFDDSSTLGAGHPSRAIIPTAFAIAEHIGDVDGKKFMTAIALGHDLECRMRESVGKDVESSFGNPTHFFGATATAGKILGLNGEKLRDALGLAFHHVSGARIGRGTAGSGASIKGMSNGFVTRAGVVSALLAERGFSIDSNFLEYENKRNFYETFYNGSYCPNILTLEIGKVFASSKTIQKEFPCCHGQHTAIMATLSLIKEYALKPSEVEHVVVHLGFHAFTLLAQPVEIKRSPHNFVEAQFSIYWGVASAIVYGEVGIMNFTEEALGDTRVRDMTHKIVAKQETEFGEHIFTPSIVEIKTVDGKTISKRIDNTFGSLENPMNLEDIAAKFRNCCEYSVKQISEKNQSKVIELIKGLEEVGDVKQIVRLLGE